MGAERSRVGPWEVNAAGSGGLADNGLVVPRIVAHGRAGLCPSIRSPRLVVFALGRPRPTRDLMLGRSPTSRGENAERLDGEPLPDRVRLVVFALDGQRYGVPLHAAEHVLPMAAPSPLPQAPPIALGVINLHGRIIPVLDIRRRFGLPPREYGLSAHLLVAHTGRRAVALPVDAVEGVREVPRDAVSVPTAVLPGLRQVAGIVALADGVLFIHDLEGFLALDEARQLDEALRGADA